MLLFKVVLEYLEGSDFLSQWNLPSPKTVLKPIVVSHYCLKMSELTKTTSTFQLQLKSSAIVVSLLLRLFAFAVGIFMAMVIDAWIFGGLPAVLEPVLLCLCVFGTVYWSEQFLLTDCEVIATQQGLLINIAKPVLLYPRSNILVEWEDITFFRSGEIRIGRYSKRTELVLIISRAKGHKLRFRKGETRSLASYLRGYLPEKERRFVGEWV